MQFLYFEEVYKTPFLLFFFNQIDHHNSSGTNEMPLLFSPYIYYNKNLNLSRPTVDSPLFDIFRVGHLGLLIQTLHPRCCDKQSFFYFFSFMSVAVSTHPSVDIVYKLTFVCVIEITIPVVKMVFFVSFAIS